MCACVRGGGMLKFLEAVLASNKPALFRHNKRNLSAMRTFLLEGTAEEG